MKKLSNWWRSLGQPNLNRAKWEILTNLTRVDTHSLALEQQITLFESVKLEFELMLLKKQIEAENDVKLCNAYFSPAQTIKSKIVDVNFDKPLSNLTKKY
jgi:hypothetical protein